MGRTLPTVAAAAIALLLAGCEDPPKDSVQRGYRGVAMVQHYDPERVAELLAQNQAPEPLSPAPEDGPLAGEVYENVQVLGDVPQARFTRLMSAITEWVAPEAGCGYCHNLAQGFANDDLYTKVVSRRMIQMTRALNTDWRDHTQQAGVTCYTCHRGNNVPANMWFQEPGSPYATRMAGNLAGQNIASEKVASASLPHDIFERFLERDTGIRVQSTQALPAGNRHSIKQTEGTYGLMMHMSQALGVNCTYCHNSRALGKWQQSTPQRVTAWHGIRMARDVNNTYITSLTDVFPPNRKGPLGDVGKVNCTTCHQGVYKPLFGANMIDDYPALAPKLQEAQAPDSMPEPAEDGESN